MLTVIASSALTAIGAPAALTRAVPLLADSDRAWVALVWVSAAAAGIATFATAGLRRRMSGLPVVRRLLPIGSFAGLALVVVMAVWQDPPSSRYPEFWTGFSVTSLLLGIAGAVGILVLLSRLRQSTPGLWAISITATVGLALLPLIQTPTTFHIGFDNAFTLDEILAVSTGRFPGFDYISQYENLLGYPLALVALVAPGAFAASPESFAVGWLVILQIGTLVGAIVAACLVSPARLRWLLPLMILPVAYLPGHIGLAYYAALPMRFVLPTVLLALVCWLGMRQIRTGRNRPVLVAGALGLAGGAAAFNNLDYGVPALLAGLSVVVLVARSWRQAATTVGAYLAGALVVPTLYVLAGTLTGRTFSIDEFLFFVRTFGVDGFMNVDMLPLGLQAGFVALGVIGIVVGVRGARRRTLRARVLHLAIAFQATWLLLSLVYFSGRSLTPTLVTGSAFLAATLLALLFVAGYGQLALIRRASVHSWSRRHWLTAVLTVLALALPIAAWTAFPTPAGAAERLRYLVSPRPGTLDYLRPDPTAALAEVADRDLVGILTVSGAIWSTLLGTVNAGLFLHPVYLTMPGAADLQCEYLATLPGRYLLTTDDLREALAESSACRDLLDLGDTLTVRDSALDPETGAEWVLVRLH